MIIKTAMKKILMPGQAFNSKGLSLVELMMTVMISGVIFVTFATSFSAISRAVQTQKYRTIANYIATEKIETLKNTTYHRLFVTTAPAYDSSVGVYYDPGYYPPEIPLIVGGIAYDRRMLVEKVREVGAEFSTITWNAGDSGVKQVTVHVKWRENQEWKHLTMRSLVDNPNRATLDAELTGNVEDQDSNPLSSAVVYTIENPAQTGVTDLTGAFSIDAETGTWTVRADKSGYFSASKSVSALSEGEHAVGTIALTEKEVAYIHGYPVLQEKVVIAAVVAATMTCPDTSVGAVDEPQEVIWLFNPTASSVSLRNLTIEAHSPGWPPGWAEETRIARITAPHNPIWISSHSYGLITNCSPYLFWGESLMPTSTYYAGFNCVQGDCDDLIPGDATNGTGGGIHIYDADGKMDDAVGWAQGAAIGPDPGFYEGDFMPLNGGLSPGAVLPRYTMVFDTYPVMLGATYGQAYDSGDNSKDFLAYMAGPPFTPWPYDYLFYDAPPGWQGYCEKVMGGTPLRGAVISADDGMSSAMTASISGWTNATSFYLAVATGTWTLSVSSNSLVSTMTVSALIGGTTYYPSREGFDGYNIIVPTTTATQGFIAGQVTSAAGAGIDDILVDNSEGAETFTANGGFYRLPVDEGAYSLVVANRGNDDPDFTESTQGPVVVVAGEITGNIDFGLSQGGVIRGITTSNEVDPLPGVIVIVKRGGAEIGAAVSDTDGVYIISNLSTGTYIVEPNLDDYETSDPGPTSIDLSPNEVNYTSFTVSSAWAYFVGDLEYYNEPIVTGVSLYAATFTFTEAPNPPGYPPPISSSMDALVYSGSSGADGRYEIAVRGGFTYNIYAYFTTYSSGGSFTVSRKQFLSEAITASDEMERDFSWP
ncbi:hypothetical protein ACFL6Y_03220 [Elusimicrobiota bacterium]